MVVVLVWCRCGVGVVWAKVVSCVPPYKKVKDDLTVSDDNNTMLIIKYK